MKIQTLHNRGRDYRSATSVANEGSRVEGSLFAAHAFGRGLKRIINGKVFEPTDQRGPMIERNAGKLSDADLSILQRSRLRVHAHVEAVRVIILVDENLRPFFRRNHLLNRIGEDGAKSEARGDVYIGRRQKAVPEVVHRVDVKARAALIRMLGIFFRAANALLNDVESGIEDRPGVRPRAQIAADSESALRENVTAQSEVRRTTERLIVPLGKTKSFLAGTAECRCQKTRSSILVLQRHRRIRQ